MKNFKRADCIVQLLLIASALVVTVLGNNRDVLSNKYFFPLYFILGGWQLLSALVHIINPVYNKKIARRIYLFALLLLTISAIIAAASGDAFLTFMAAVLFITPVMAVYYCVVCMAETRAIRRDATSAAA